MSPTVPNLSQINPVCFFTAFSSEFHCNVIFPCKIFLSLYLFTYFAEKILKLPRLSIVYTELTRAGSEHLALDYKRLFPDDVAAIQTEPSCSDDELQLWRTDSKHRVV